MLGFFPRPAPAGLVGWAARVERKVAVEDYEAAFPGRPDAVYRFAPDGSVTRLRPDYHAGEDQIRKDLSAPVLVFDPEAAWYFGDRPRLLPEPLMHLAASGQGHRVNGRRPGDESALAAWLAEQGPPGILGRPRHGGSCAPCGGVRAAKASGDCRAQDRDAPARGHGRALG
ncbi:MAG TPA: hypothetical protein VF547_05270 [Allosphingosinicella sp.]